MENVIMNPFKESQEIFSANREKGLKRKREAEENDELEELLFDEFEENVILENIDDKVLEEEDKLPLSRPSKVSLNINIGEHIFNISMFIVLPLIDSVEIYK